MSCPGDTVSSPDVQEHAVLCGHREAEAKKDFGHKEGWLLWGAFMLGVSELPHDVGFVANPLWTWCPFLQKNDAEKCGW